MKRYLTILSVASFLYAGEYDKYTVSIEVSSVKKDGKAWDISGGAPDILVEVNDKTIDFDAACKNTYRCSVSFLSADSKWYFEVYDKDIKDNDLIGKGSCSVGAACKLGLATLKIAKFKR